jgi:hypothetical protein
MRSSGSAGFDSLPSSALRGAATCTVAPSSILQTASLIALRVASCGTPSSP